MTLIFSCKKINYFDSTQIPSDDSEASVNSETSLEDFQENPKYTNIHIHKDFKVTDKELEEFKIEFDKRVDLLYDKFEDAEALFGKTRESLKSGKLRINLTASYKKKNYDSEIKKYPNICFLGGEVIRNGFKIYKNLLPFFFQPQTTEPNLKLDYNSFLSDNLEKLFFSDSNEIAEDLKDFDLFNFNSINTDINSTSISPKVMNAIFLNSFRKPEVKLRFKKFQENIIHLAHLISIYKISICEDEPFSENENKLIQLKTFIGRLKSNNNLEIDNQIFQKITKSFNTAYSEIVPKIKSYSSTYDWILIRNTKEIRIFVDRDFTDEVKANPTFSDLMEEYLKTYHKLKKGKMNIFIIYSDTDSYDEAFSEKYNNIIVYFNQLFSSKSITEIKKQLIRNEYRRYIEKNPIFRKYYRQIRLFTEEHLDEMHLDMLLKSYYTLFTLSKETDLKSPKIQNLDELIDFKKSDLGIKLTEAPNEDELTYFLKKTTKEQLNKFDLDNPEQYTKNFLHFRHLLTNVRLAKGYKYLTSGYYVKLRFDLKNFLEDPLGEITDQDFESQMQFFFNPFTHFTNKIKEFWEFEYDLRAYILNHYHIQNTLGSCMWGNYPGFYDSKVHKSNKRNPLLNLSFNKTMTMKSMLNSILPHELGHHLQQSGNYIYDSSFGESPKVRQMASELEADMYAGFYAAHRDGFNLPKNELLKTSEDMYKNFGDPQEDLEKSMAPHGMGYQRKRAYLLGMHLAKLPRFQTVSKLTIYILHSRFIDVYKKTNYLRNIENAPEYKPLFSDKF